ncbi:MAG: Ig-like domain repeat protein [Methanobrevibacter sp.]|uniref:Ig-like domain repeat protein n=1 Tax=Methanobrevibacter sp. TaxID=66852 RepID=UPI0025E0D032|nr:Ig-like domain repeat protein [Methanobrevibacter sp.]MBQ8016554.1 Ig-like domain repeat protein [Methanobrevibacter sp.]
MNNKKILMSIFLVVLIAISVSSVSAEDVQDVVATDDVDSVSQSDIDEVVGAEPISPDNDTYDAIQKAVDSTNDGDTVDLSKYAEYDIGNKTIAVTTDNIVIKGNGATTIKGDGAGKGLISVNAKSVTIQGIRFIDTNSKNNLVYDGSVNGWGISFNGAAAEGGIVDNCYFKDFNQAVVVSSSNYITIKNSEFEGGYATKLLNDPTVNKETGSKVISVGGSFFTTILNNTFDGVVLDAISIAQASGDAKIINNTFKNNVYSIFFGGASTDGTYITGNTFINCGSFDDGVHSWSAYPVISIQKASSGVFIDNNTFKVIDDNWLIAAEQGNTAHGYPSTLGNINVTNNIVEKYNDDVVTSGVTLLHILCRSGMLNPYEEITITGNQVADGVKTLVVWNNDWGTESSDTSDIVIPKAELVQTQIAITAIDGTKITGVLKDIAGKAIDSADLTYSINNGADVKIVTDENGIFTINGEAGKAVTINFAQTSKFAASQNSITLTPVTQTQTVTQTVAKKAVTLKAPKATFKVKKVKKVKITLKSAGKAIAGKKVTIHVNGKSFSAKTNKKGVATIKVKLTKKGTYSYVASFAGDSTYNAGLKAGKIVVKK